VVRSFALRVPGPEHIVPCCVVYQWSYCESLGSSALTCNPSGNNQHGPAKECVPPNTNLLIFSCETGCILDQADSELRAAFEKLGR